VNGFVLDAYAARSCPVKTQNHFHPAMQLPRLDDDESLHEAFLGGASFKTLTMNTLLERFAGRAVDCRSLSNQSWQVQVDAATAAMADGVDVVIGGVLPLDVPGHRSGRADLYLRGPDTDAGTPGYHPVQVKYHRVLERQTPGPDREPQRLSRLGEPLLRTALDEAEQSFRFSSRELDLLQLAHYWRLLEAAGFAAGGGPWAGIVGTDQVASLGNVRVISWVRLDVKAIRTFSRTAATGWRRRSPLERYDHEHGFRVKVAQVASASAARPTIPARRHADPRRGDRCVWWETRRPCSTTTTPSVRIDKSPLDVREIAVLRARASSRSPIWPVDLDALLPSYLPGWPTGTVARSGRLAAGARLMLSVELERTTQGPVGLPIGEIEIDFDIETSAEDRVYLWGFLVHETGADGEGSYVEFSEFSELTDAAELSLAVAAVTWLRELVAANPDARVRVFHYSDYELVRLTRLAAADPSGTLAWATEFAADAFCDLFEVMRANFFGTHGLGLKHGRPRRRLRLADDDPGGLNSQRWFDDAVHAESPVSARRRAACAGVQRDDGGHRGPPRRWLR
jgi:hypothetical protein